MSYSFQCTDISPTWSNLFLGILISLIQSGIVFLFLSKSLLLVDRNTNRQVISVY